VLLNLKNAARIEETAQEDIDPTGCEPGYVLFELIKFIIESVF
jgi:hypothetical protein